MRVLHLISQRPDSTGSGIYLQELLDLSARSGHENHLVAGIQREQLPTIRALPSERCTYVEFPGAELDLEIVGMSDVMPYASARFRDLTREEVALYERAFANATVPLVESFRPEIIHSHHLWLLSSLAARLFPSIPLVVTCHGSDLRQFRNCPHLRSRVLSGCRHIAAVLALSRPQKEEISRLYGLPRQRISIAGGGYNSLLFSQAAKPPPAPVRLIYAGKLSAAKGVVWLLRALAELGEVDYHLDLVGSGAGEEQQSCLALTQKLGARVTVHGSLPQEQLATLMRQAHVMVLPSLFEGLPLSMLEAIGCGCRVVATELPGTREIADHLDTRYIRLVPAPRLYQVDRILPEDEPRFVSNLSRTISETVAAAKAEPDIALDELREKIDFYSWEQVWARTESVYRRVLAETGTTG